MCKINEEPPKIYSLNRIFTRSKHLCNKLRIARNIYFVSMSAFVRQAIYGKCDKIYLNLTRLIN
jgi:hypothetical protein